MSEFDQSANEAGIAVTTQLFRLIRSAQMHEVASLLSQGTLETAAKSLRELTGQLGGFVVVMFADDTVFVNGQPVRAQRSVYENILAVGTHLAGMSVNELTIRSGVTAKDLGQLVEMLVKNIKHRLPSSIYLQYVDPAKFFGNADGQQSIVTQVAGVYGAAVVLVRRCDAQIREDNPRLMRHVKRVAQRLVTLTHTGFPELLALARRAPAPTDLAAIAVNSAIIGALTGRTLTEDIHVLLRITMGALQADLGKPRVAGMYRPDTFQTTFVPQLNQHMRRRLPASTAVMLLQAGRAAEQPLMRAVTAYESAHLGDGQLLGWPYDGQIAPTVEAVIASVARRVSEAMVSAANPDDLVRTLQAVELGKVERAALDIVMSVLGLMPVGTPVELGKGGRGVVVSSGKDFANLERPRIVLLLDAARKPVDPRVIIAGGPEGWVKQAIVQPDEFLARQYEAYVANRNDDEQELPSTTGVLSPDVGDHLVDRATLDFDSEAASSIVDGSAAAAFAAQDPSGTIMGHRPDGPIVSQFPVGGADPSSSVPPQFREGDGIPAQFQKSSPDEGGVELDFMTAAEAANAPPAQFRKQPDNDDGKKVPGAWVRPTSGSDKAPAAEKPVDPESKTDDDSSEDGDFDALKDIVLFD